MEILPALDLRGGRCVRLLQGDYERETVFGDDPVETALRWQQLGAPRLHVVDLEGARSGSPAEAETIERIVREASIPVQVAGGIRSLQQAHRYLQAGADRVVFGTAAVRDPELVHEALKMDEAAVVVALDARDGRIRTDGWLQSSELTVRDLAARMQALGVRRVLMTDISRDGTLTEPNFAALAELQLSGGFAVIASGGVTSLAHITQLAHLGLEGAIIGQALYSGALSLPEALCAATQA